VKVLRFEDLVRDGQAAGQRVFIRADLNVPLGRTGVGGDDAGAITEDTRIRASVPCIALALKAGAAVMVTSHLGSAWVSCWAARCRWSRTGSTA